MVVVRKKGPPVYTTEGTTVLPSSLLLTYWQAPRDLRHTPSGSPPSRSKLSTGPRTHTEHSADPLPHRTTLAPSQTSDLSCTPRRNQPPNRTVRPIPHAPQPRPRPPEPPAATSKPGHPAEPTGNQRLSPGAISRAPLTA